ncbi:MAG: hypothetical protein JWP01_686 [Myxococcales bacterium]|nr:hypothetical protein [Myxococcales bacterium]
MRRLFILLAAMGGSCGGSSVAPPLSNHVTSEPCVRSSVPAPRRFALGTTPDANMVENAPPCWIELIPSHVVELRDGMPVLVEQGTFRGACGGMPLADEFESVRVASVEIRQTLVHDGLQPGELVAAHADWPIGLRVFAADACGELLQVGRRPNGLWSARNCGNIARIEGVNAPRDEITVTPLGRGTCTIAVDFLGASSRFILAVR